jgi:hypothetical protein
MPITQHLWSWDHFLHGGPDFELGALMVLIFLSLVLVLSKHSERCLHLLFAQWRFRGFNLTARQPNGISLPGERRAFQIAPSTALGIYSVRIQI